MSDFARQFNAALKKAMSRSEAASLAGKASAAARRAKSGASASGDSAFDQASAKANAIIAANPGKYGPKGAKGAKGKGKAGAKGKAAKDPAAAKAKAAKEAQATQEHAQRQQEHEADRAQHQQDREQHQKEHAQAQAEHAQSRAEHEADRAARQKQQAAKAKASSGKKSGGGGKGGGGKGKNTTPEKNIVLPEVAAAATALSSGGAITPAQSQQLVTNGLAKPQKDGSLVLTSLGLKAARQQVAKAQIASILASNGYVGIDPSSSPLLKAFDSLTSWHGWASITKVDAEQRIVYGIATSESPDDQPGIYKGEQYRGDIISSAAMKAAAPDYLQWANLREMHGNTAAGTVVHFDVRGPDTEIAAHVVDDQAWKKVITGTYKGFSIGGKMVDAEIVKIDGASYRRITKLKLTEISLVDRPANPQARITLFKGADMETEQDATEVADDTLAKAADPTKAIALLQQLRNDAETSGDMDAADEYTAAIRSVAQAAGIATTAEDDSDTEPDADDAGGGLAMDDGSDPGTDMAMAQTVGDLRKAHPELSDEGLIALLLKQPTAALTKRGAAISGNTMGHLQNAHDSIQKASGGATCAQPGQPNGIAMAATLAPDDLAKALTPAFDGIAKVLEQNGLVVAGLAKRLEHLESQPAPGAPAARVVVVEKSLPGAVPPVPVDPDAATLDVLRKQLDQADDPAVQRYLSNQISQIEFKKVYR